MKLQTILLLAATASASAFAPSANNGRPSSSINAYGQRQGYGYEDVNTMSLPELKRFINEIGFDERGHDRGSLIMIAKGYPEAVRARPLSARRGDDIYDRDQLRNGIKKKIFPEYYERDMPPPPGYYGNPNDMRGPPPMGRGPPRGLPARDMYQGQPGRLPNAQGIPQGGYDPNGAYGNQSPRYRGAP